MRFLALLVLLMMRTGMVAYPKGYSNRNFFEYDGETMSARPGRVRPWWRLPERAVDHAWRDAVTSTAKIELEQYP
ncbi:hypothetical protein ACVOMS_27190 [Bradyrhizobium guangxiense]